MPDFSKEPAHFLTALAPEHWVLMTFLALAATEHGIVTLSQQDIATQLQVSRGTINRWLQSLITVRWHNRALLHPVYDQAGHIRFLQLTDWTDENPVDPKNLLPPDKAIQKPCAGASGPATRTIPQGRRAIIYGEIMDA
jgi:hypothetical protein